LVTISGNAVIRTTKIGVAGESPNQMMAKIAQIADDRQDRLEEGAERTVRAEQDAAGHADDDRNREARKHAAKRREEIERQVARLRELHDAHEDAIGLRQHIGRHRERDQPPYGEQHQRERKPLRDHGDACGGAGGDVCDRTHGNPLTPTLSP
jgi:hypothetical protein